MAYKPEVVEVDSGGRVAIPKKIRKRTHIGKFIEVNYTDRQINLKPIMEKDIIHELEGSLTSKKSFPELRKEAENLFLNESKKHLKNVD